MGMVCVDLREVIHFVPEVLLAANAMKGGMEILRPILAKADVEPIGKIVIGTVKGDVHDIGKNLVGMMLEGAGFEVIDLGINNPVEKYLAALEQHRPDILGMSALLTTTMPYMKVVIDTLKEKGLREDYIVRAGGALDEVLAAEGVERIAGAHCYEFFATTPIFTEMADAEPASFYLTDFLARHFDRLVWKGLGIDRHPELLPLYFGNYRRLVYL